MPVGVADDLHVAAGGPVFAGIPQVKAGVGVDRAAAVSADEGAVERRVGPAGGVGCVQDLVQVRFLFGERSVAGRVGRCSRWEWKYRSGRRATTDRIQSNN